MTKPLKLVCLEQRYKKLNKQFFRQNNIESLVMFDDNDYDEFEGKSRFFIFLFTQPDISDRNVEIFTLEK